MIPAIQEYNSVTQQNRLASYATLHQATVSLQEMGERTISTQVRIDGSVVPDFNGWELRFKGERFVLNTKDPQAMKDNTTRNSLVDLTFTSWVINELKRYYMFEPASVDAGTVMADKYKAQVGLNVEDFAVFFNKILNYYFGGKVVFSLYLPGTGRYSTDRVYVDLNYTYIWDVLTKFYELYGVRWTIDYNSTTDVYTIKAGYQAPSISDHDFEYGYHGGLLKFERQVQDVDIRNILLGRGGEKNLPYRYFKLSDPQNPEWAADPDAIPELANITFDRLRDVNFRWYVRGWMHNPNRDTSGDEAWDPGHVFPTYTIDSSSPYYWAYQKGLTDETFNPVEYVKDDASIAEYGERWGAVEDNDEIFPTIQGISRDPIGRIDETVAVSEIVTDDIEEMAKNAAIETSLNSLIVSTKGTQTQFTLESEEFTIPVGSTGNIRAVPTSNETVAASGLNYVDTTQTTMVVVDSVGNEYPISGIAAGTYRLKINLVIHIGAPSGKADGTFGYESIKLTTSDIDADAWKPTFDIWVKNIWNTSKNSGESDVQYSNRVWGPILGDRAGNEAKVVFSTGFMSISEDYEFVIIGYPVRDTSKTILVDGVEIQSEWRITLRKSDAEYDATGLYIPNATTGGAPIAGDKFFFTGIDMPHMYVEEAEKSLNTNKEAALDTTASVSPTWIINLDKVRCNTLEDGEYGQTLAERLAPGTEVWITDPRFTPGTRLMLYVNSMTYTWNEPSDDAPYLVPDIEVVLSDKVMATESAIGKIQNDISMVKEQYARISDVEKAVMSVAGPMFLKKTGESDTSDSPTQFASKVTSKGFRQGAVGGRGWGLYRDNTDAMAEGDEDAEGDSVLEVDKMIVRKTMQVNSLVVNQVEYRGGMEIISAASITVSKVIETASSYICYFDQRQNSVANNFAVNDIAYGQVFSPSNSSLRYYKCLVTAVDVDRIELSKTTKDGAGEPEAGDVIVQFGNTTNSARQYVIVRDVVGGGYERMLSGLNSVSATGNEYYYAGRSNGQSPRWFVGDANGEYAEWVNGQLNIKGSILVKNGNTYTDMSTALGDLDYLTTALPESSTLIAGGLILSKVIALTDASNNIQAGINGVTSLSDIAAWYGGPMADKEATPTPQSYAQSLFRFDGSGYLAGGNITWGNTGYGSIPGITWQSDGHGGTDVIIGANVKLASVSGDTVTSLVTTVQNLPNDYVTIATTQTITGKKTFSHADGVKIGDATLKWHAPVGNTPGYLEIDSALVTAGDQIVISGTPGQGGGGGGGAGYLYELGDVYSKGLRAAVFRADDTAKQNGDLLAYNSSKNAWVALPQSAVSPDLTGYVNALTISGSGDYVASLSKSGSTITATMGTLGAAAGYAVASSVTQGDTSHLVTGAAVWTAIDNLPEPMVFKGSLGTGGTITALPVNGTASIGDTYKVITAGTYAGQTAKVGDTFICQTKTSSANTWVLIPSGDEPEGTVTSVKMSLPTGLVLGTGSTNPITTSGEFKVALDTGYSIPLAADVTKGVTAYGWGDHANAGYLLASVAATTYHPLGGSTTLNTFKIGGATLTWHPETSSGAGDSYLELDSAIITSGDQIVISGTPGQGGGGTGGASYLYELTDTLSGWIGNSVVSTGQVLMYDASALNKSGTGAWKYATLGISNISGLQSALDGKQAAGNYQPLDADLTAIAALTGPSSGQAFLKRKSDDTWVLDTNTYLTGNQTITLSGDVTGSGTTSITTTIGTGKVTNAMLAGSINWSKLLASSLPTTLAGYGITDGVNDVEVTGTGNAVTTASISGHKLTLTKGSTFLTGNQTITLSGDVSGSGATSIAVSIGEGKVTNAMLAGSINWSKLLASSLPTTLSGYGITDGVNDVETTGSGNAVTTASISGHKLTLTKGTTFLTAHQTIYALTLAAGSFTAGTYTPNSAAASFNIPTTLDHITDGSTRKLADYVTLATAQTISGKKTFSHADGIVIGSATIKWEENGGNGYLYIDKPIVTAGDQIVISGTPGQGGGGGGAGYLYELLDVNPSAKPSGSATKLLAYNPSLADKNNSLGAWGYVDASTLHGESAYEIWLDEGNVGTKQDFLASLQGDSGYSGAAGELEVVNNLVDGGPTAALSAEMGKLLNNKIDSRFKETSEDGWFVTDESLNVALKYDSSGLDAAKLSDHFKSLIGNTGGGDFIQVLEDGLYFVDESMNIGVKVDEDGIHAPNILEYQIVSI